MVGLLLSVNPYMSAERLPLLRMNGICTVTVQHCSRTGP